MEEKYAKVKTSLPGPKSKTLLEEWHKYEVDKTGYQAQVAIESGQGALLFDVDGNSFLDWTSGVLVTNVGHCHPILVKAIQNACSNILNVYEYCTPYRVNAARDLVNASPKFLDRCFFMSAGSEATDIAMKVMKRASGNFEIISFFGGFHGRTFSTGSAGGLAKPKYRFGPTTPGIIRSPYPYCYRCPFKQKPETCNFLCLEFLNDVVDANSTGSLAGVIIEPYQGAAGFIFPPAGWLPQLEKWIREKRILFSLDEVQSSFGRTGKMWALEWEKLEPDIISIGKGLGSGISVSAVLMKHEIVDETFQKGELGSTYGGNPVSCAAVSAVLKIIKQEDLLTNVNKIGELFSQRLKDIKEKSCYLGDVRGRGLVFGMELVEDKETKTPARDLTLKLIDKCAINGLLIGSVGYFGNVIRVAPPLTINEAQANESLDIMEKSLLSL